LVGSHFSENLIQIRLKENFMEKNAVSLKMIFFLLLSIGLFSSNTLAQSSDGFGDLKLQVVAGKPAIFDDKPVAGGKYPAGDATVSIYKPNVDFFFEDYTDYKGQLLIRALPAGLNNYKILFWDFKADRWSAEGSVIIKNGELSTKLVELKRETWYG
jgi:hypothetical protein